MPWCFECDRYLAPNTVSVDGKCPSCGQPIDPAEPVVSGRAVPNQSEAAVDSQGGAAVLDQGVDDEATVRAPWHFWVMIVAVVLYLGWRFIQGFGWVLEHWF